MSKKLLIETWQEGRTDNVDVNNPLSLYTYIPVNAKEINKAYLNFEALHFASYGVGSIKTTSAGYTPINNGGGIVSSNYKSDKASNIGIIINGVDRTTELGGKLNLIKGTLDISPYLEFGKWNKIELTSETLGRINASLLMEVTFYEDDLSKAWDKSHNDSEKLLQSLSDLCNKVVEMEKELAELKKKTYIPSGLTFIHKDEKVFSP